MDSNLNETNEDISNTGEDKNSNNANFNPNPKKVAKRTGEIEDFNNEKIKNAIYAAFNEVYPFKTNTENNDAAVAITQNIISELKLLNKEVIEIEKIQDIIEMVLMKSDPAVAKSFILYRQKHTAQRAFRASLGIPHDNLKLPLNSLIVLAARYLLKSNDGKIIESPNQLFERVAKSVASAEKKYGKSDTEIKDLEKKFYDIISTFKFMPNSPTLMNAGTANGQLSACFVLPIGDSLPEIYDTLKYAALIQQSGGGTGFAFSRIRPFGDNVRSTSGIASGPISFMKVFNVSTETIKQGGKRRGANMGILRIDHPNILDFIVLKESEGVMQNFNISVAVTDTFMKALKNNTDYNLINPRNAQVVGRLNARAVWNLIITMAWKTGDPGIVFIDRINASYSNPVPKYGPIESTNPCGEQPLYPYDSCNLGSINLAKMVKRTDHHFEVDWDELRRVVHLAIRVLDNIIEVNKYPIPEIDKMSKAIRRVGLGIMGWADMLIKLGIRYDSNEALMLAENVMKFINDNARKASEELAVERGPFPDFNDSIWARLGFPPLRNSTVTTLAPTGSISIIAGGSSQGIEPIFSVVYLRNVRESLGSSLLEINNEFEALAIENNFYSEELMQKLAGMTSIQEVEEIPLNIRKLFVTAHDISPEWHVKMQAAFQKYTDSAVSKTINFPNWATPQDIEKAYNLAWELNCKGITVYRDASKSIQVLQTVKSQQPRLHEVKAAHNNVKDVEGLSMQAVKESASSYTFTVSNAPECSECGTMMIAGSGCFTCPKCGYSLCDSS
ncbi:MAG: adenosylcobalamin-dependent ribonucleoside-diphosphate reductase [Candidatus Marsarchaeota archaeon]|jgi:ribonucleoside-diphosphate reductase alpha chain|nr:adenosylcobalamin-dependent ribonucleoside-diphosphate reductase [Candidatus Marsarchaeota archaeon]